jgi:hypothetical protein
MCEMDKKISEMTWEDLQIVDISSTHPLRFFIDEMILKSRLRILLLFSRNFAGEQVPKLEDAIEECLKLDLRVFIDLKDNDTRVGFI